MLKINQWMLTVILTICSMMVVTSCSNDDNSTSTEEPQTTPEVLADNLVGTWYALYEAHGTAVSEDSGKDVAYNTAIDIYYFFEDGSGTFIRCFFNDDKMRPALVQGILGYGKFNYSCKAGGVVSISLKYNWKQAYPQTWDVSYAGETIAAKGVDGQTLQLEQPDETMKNVLNKMVDVNGATTQYDVNDYKPLDVDNSQWMKSLADDRLVASLSLPGCHDACTGEGWKSSFLEILYELTAKCQDLTIAEQLKAGVRVFDLRPERVYESKSYVLRCSHGIAPTKMLVADFFRTLQEFMTANPTEFCILTVNITASDEEAWASEFSELIRSSEFSGLFADFKPRLTVGEMRGHILMLSRYEYDEKPLGGYCYGWGDALEFEKQSQGYILGSDAVQTPLWVQDYWGKQTRDGKDEAILKMLEEAAARDMTADRPAWVINYTAAYFGTTLSDSYRENATMANVVAADWLESHDGPVGIIYMDYAGMDKSVGFSGDILYETAGMRLINQIIQQNAVAQ